VNAKADPYRDWPYAEAYLLETLDPDLIESHARQILSRALNIGRVVAFVGAGVAMSYGRISWRELVNTEHLRVRAHLEAFIDYFRKQLPSTPPLSDDDVLAEPRFGHIRRLKAVLDALNLDDRREVRSERFPMIFQLCEQLDNALCSIDWIPKRPIQKMRQHAMELTIDERGHAKQILIDALLDKDGDESFDGDPRDLIADTLGDTGRDPIQGTRDPTSHRLFYRKDQTKTLLRLTESSTRCARLRAAITFLVDRPPAEQGSAQYLLPTERYVVGALLRLLPQKSVQQTRSSNEWWSEIANKVAKWKKRQPIADARRNELVFQYRDPLLQLQERLEISRYLTTNYDHEIERLLQDQGYRQSTDTTSRGPSTFLTPNMRELVFDNKNAGKLIAFAAQDRSRNGMVVHLHGRADIHDATAEIIVTESDYQRRYLRTDESRDLVDDAIRLTFGANPVLFVGSNMGEDDILRPLRQFMSNPSRVGDRIAVAIVPALEDKAARTQEKIAHLGRYGVYTIHFGRANVEFADPEQSSREIDDGLADWLPWVWQIKRDIDAAFGRIFKLSFQDAQDPDRVSETASILPTEKNLRDGPELANGASGGMAQGGRFARGGFITPLKCIEGINTNRRRALDLDGEIEIFNAAIEWLRTVAGMAIHTQEEHADVSREARAHRVALSGASDAILAVFTCARLIRARWDWDDWKQRWYSLPRERSAMDGGSERVISPVQPFGAQPSKNPDLLVDGAISVHRNGICLLAMPEPLPRRGRFYAGAPSQTFFGLIGALKSSEATPFREAEGRRILLLSGRRGLGKGHFFSALDDCGATGEIGLRLSEFLKALSPPTPQPNSPCWTGVAFYNLSFAHEVMSAFDHLTWLLLERLPRQTPDVKAQVIAQYESLKHDRIERLRALLTAWAMIGKGEPHERILVAFNSIGILFDEDGRAKNGQVKRIFDLLFSDDFASAPIDFVLVCQDEYIPRDFRQDFAHKGWEVVLLERSNIDAKSMASNRRQWDALNMNSNPIGSNRHIDSVEDIVWQRPEEPRLPEPWHTLRVGKVRPVGSLASQPRRSAVAIHILHEARATIITASYFPRIGLMLARHHLRQNAAIWKFVETVRQNGNQFPNIFEESAVAFRAAMRDALNVVKPDGLIPPKIMIPAITVVLSLMVEIGIIEGTANDLEEHFTSLVKELNSALSANLSDDEVREHVSQRAFEIVLKQLEDKFQCSRNDGPKWKAEFGRHLHEVVRSYDHRLRNLHTAVGGGRFLLTLLLAGAYEATTRLSAPDFAQSKTVPLSEINAVTYAVDRFLERAALSLRGVPSRRHSDVVILQYFSILHRHHERGEILPVPVRLHWTGTAFEETRTANPSMYRLLMEVLWHLAIMGQAVEADILAWCPRIRQACNELCGSQGSLSEEQYFTCVEEALALGINRCLLFQLHPEPNQKDTKPGDNQKDSEPEASQEEIIPEPNQKDTKPGRDQKNAKPETSVKDIKPEPNQKDPKPRYAVHGLIQRDVFQKLGARDAEFTDTDQFTLSLYASQPDDLPRLNRDAHNQIAAAIAALAGYPDTGAGSGVEGPDRGARAELHRDLPSDYRKRLLRAAFGIMRSIYSVAVLARFDHDPQGVEGTPGHEGYFEEYRRVVRWILSSALDMTSSTPSPCEPFYAEELVWLYNECAVLSLSQGRLSDAQALFEAALLAVKRLEPDATGPLHVRILVNKAVVDIERGYGSAARVYLERIALMIDEHPVPPLLAKGYLGLIDHLAGEVGAATSAYKEAIAGLVKLRRARAASIFSRHHGDLLSSDVGEGRLAEARQELHNALHFAQEGGHEDIRHMALLSLARCQMREATKLNTGEIHSALDNVERYARIVGMPRLLCEVGLIRARLLLLQGEVRLAASLATESLQIATVNDLRIRKITSLLLLAEIYLKRNDDKTVRALLALGGRMAKLCNHFFALTHAQSFEHRIDPASG
jgi:tetratricopeptide (TPR) repeat protein